MSSRPNDGEYWHECECLNCQFVLEKPKKFIVRRYHKGEERHISQGCLRNKNIATFISNHTKNIVSDVLHEILLSYDKEKAIYKIALDWRIEI